MEMTITYDNERRSLKVFKNGHPVGGMIGQIAQRHWEKIQASLNNTDYTSMAYKKRNKSNHLNAN